MLRIAVQLVQLNFYTKYMYKGHNRAIAEFHTGDSSESSKTKKVDEIVNYLEARYVSATVFAFELCANLPRH